MVLELILGCVLFGLVIILLRVCNAYNKFEETRRDSEWDK